MTAPAGRGTRSATKLQETLNLLRKEIEEANERYKELLNKFEINRTETISSIQDYSEKNLDSCIRYPENKDKKLYIRIYTEIINLEAKPEENIELIVNNQRIRPQTKFESQPKAGPPMLDLNYVI